LPPALAVMVIWLAVVVLAKVALAMPC